jgi:hypothetical protein
MKNKSQSSVQIYLWNMNCVMIVAISYKKFCMLICCNTEWCYKHAGQKKYRNVDGSIHRLQCLSKNIQTLISIKLLVVDRTELKKIISWQ